LNIPDNVKGAVVTEVAPNSASAEAGLKPGDVITEINHHDVASANDAVRLTEHAKRQNDPAPCLEQGWQPLPGGG
jgi:serine protease Do